MSTPNGSSEASPNVSYLRTIDPLDALAAKQSISDYFTPVQEPSSPAARTQSGPIEPKRAIWIIGGGIALVIAGLLTFAFLHQLPLSMRSIEGLWLGIGGIVVVAFGIIYAAIWERKSPGQELSPVQIAANKANPHISKQIDHFRKYADYTFNKSRDGTTVLRRADLVGIGRKEWNGNHEVQIIEIKGERIDAAVVHLVSVELNEQFLLVCQVGLQLTTGTTFAESSSRHLLTDILAVQHDERKLVATRAWDRASEIAKEIKKLKGKGYDDTSEEVRKLKGELGDLDFDEPAGNRFVITLANQDNLELVIADCDHPNNRGDVGYPIGGVKNLKAATEFWKAVAAASENAKSAQHIAVTGVKDGLDAYQSKVVEGMGSVQSQLASLEAVMKEVLAAIKSGGGGGATVGVPAGTYSNGHGAAVAAAAPAPDAPTAPTPQPLPDPAKTGA